MPIMKSFSRLLSRPASRLLQGSVDQAIQSAFEQKDLADRAEVESLRQRATELAEQVRSFTERLGALELRATQLHQDLSESQQRARETTLELEQTRAELERLRQASTPPAADPSPILPAQTEPSPEPFPEPSSEPSLSCQVVGCEGAYRSRGFCSPHYQKWRRGTLAGFVQEGGIVQDGASHWKIDPELAALPFVVDSQGTLHVGSRTFGPAERSQV